jgi:superfamily II DNA or RNA helicase
MDGYFDFVMEQWPDARQDAEVIDVRPLLPSPVRSVARPHQTRTLDAIRESYFRGKRRILVVGPTGSGKMFVAAKILESSMAKGKYACFIADQRELVQQCRKELESQGVSCTTIMRGEDENVASRVRVISKDTLWSRAFKRKTEEIPRADVVIMDEAHRSLSKTWRGIANHYANAVLIGFTATPIRTDGRGFGDFYDDLIVMATYKELQSQGFLVPIKLFAPTRPNLKGIKTSAGDYAKGQLESRMNRDALVGDIVKDWKKRADGIATVAFASGINHSIHIRNEFRRIGLRAEHIAGTTELTERADILAAVADGRVDMLCNYGVVTTGVDLPILKCAIVARPTKSFGLWRQMCGRIQRPYAGYEWAIVLDHSAAWERHGFPDEDVEWSLNEKETVQERKERNRKEGKCPICGNPMFGVKCSICGYDRTKDWKERTCEKCAAVFKGPTCPHCGYRPERAPRRVEMTPGELSEVERKKANKGTAIEDKQRFWEQQCVGRAIGMNKPMKVAASIYKQKFGVWPNRTKELKYAASAAHGDMPAIDFYREFISPHKMKT